MGKSVTWAGHKILEGVIVVEDNVLRLAFECQRRGTRERRGRGQRGRERAAAPWDRARCYVSDQAHHAVGKALSLRESYPQALILACDQLGECEGRVLAKPGTEARAREQLRFLAGKEHRLHNAVALLDARDGRLLYEMVTSRLRMRPLTGERIDRYVELERPVDSAGSYRSESLGVALFESMGGDDPTAIIGLPLLWVVIALYTARRSHAQKN